MGRVKLNEWYKPTNSKRKERPPKQPIMKAHLARLSSVDFVFMEKLTTLPNSFSCMPDDYLFRRQFAVILCLRL